MAIANVVHEIDQEITRLQTARNLLTEDQPHPVNGTVKHRLAAAPKHRKISAAGRKRIAAAQRARWARLKRAA
jgi:hypothetical protein